MLHRRCDTFAALRADDGVRYLAPHGIDVAIALPAGIVCVALLLAVRLIIVHNRLVRLRNQVVRRVAQSAVAIWTATSRTAPPWA
jgi:hypothetical protein